MKLRSTCSILAVGFMLFGCSAKSNVPQLAQMEDGNILNQLDSVEYKILLTPDQLADESGYSAIWQIVEETAKEQKVSVETEDDPLKVNYRNIQYLDTGNRELRAQGYTLRYRQKYKKFEGVGSTANKLGTKYDVTLKYRNSDKMAALDSKIVAGKKRFNKEAKKTELEADVTTNGVIFSHAAKLKLKEEKRGTFADLFNYKIKGDKGYETIFPLLGQLEMFGTAIIPVGDTTILEAKAEPGKLVFANNVKPEVAISLFNSELGEPIVGEVSFDFDIKDDDFTVGIEELRQIDAYYKALMKNLGDKVSTEGSTKTGFVYALPE